MSFPTENVKKLLNDPNFEVLIKWLQGKRDYSLKTFSSPFPAENLHMHVHMGGRYSAFEEILNEIQTTRKLK